MPYVDLLATEDMQELRKELQSIIICTFTECTKDISWLKFAEISQSVVSFNIWCDLQDMYFKHLMKFHYTEGFDKGSELKRLNDYHFINKKFKQKAFELFENLIDEINKKTAFLRLMYLKTSEEQFKRRSE